LEEFARRYEELTPEEREYSELLTVLIEAFETANYALEAISKAQAKKPVVLFHVPADLFL
jgi:hypothetical protein